MHKVAKYGLLIVSALIFLPVLFLALRAEWQYDEAWTYLSILHSRYKDIALYKEFRLANNHVINSLYFHWLQGLGARAEVFYRLVSLLSYATYCVFIYKLLQLQRYKWSNISYLVLFLLPYMGFFALGRGYAPAIACFVASLYYYRAFANSKTNFHLLLFVIFGCLSSLSLFSFAFPFIAMLVTLSLTNLNYVLKPLRIVTLLLALPVIAYVFYMGRIVNSYDQYIIGGNSLFRNGLLSSIISYLSLSDMVSARVFLILKIILCLNMAAAAIVLMRRKTLCTEHLIAIVTVLLMIVSHLAFGSKYPMFRGLIYLVLLMYLPLVYANIKQHLLLSSHLLVVCCIGVLNLVILIGKSEKHKSYDTVAYMSHMHNTVYVDNVNPNMVLYNHLYFGDSVRILQYEMEEPEISAEFIKALDTAAYVVASPSEINLKKPGSFVRKYEMPEDNFYIRQRR
ncbi:MAG: hypothetical protein JSS82_00945 [Bacteroidetes bacterium]|nr:hypothetical protein [Bacteroidota bacterium]